MTDHRQPWRVLIGSRSFGQVFPEHIRQLEEAGCEVIPNGVGRAYRAHELKTALVGGLGRKPRQAFGPVRVAISGRTVSPPLYESIELLGRERTLARLRAARALTGEPPAPDAG